MPFISPARDRSITPAAPRSSPWFNPTANVFRPKRGDSYQFGILSVYSTMRSCSLNCDSEDVIRARVLRILRRVLCIDVLEEDVEELVGKCTNRSAELPAGELPAREVGFSVIGRLAVSALDYFQLDSLLFLNHAGTSQSKCSICLYNSLYKHKWPPLSHVTAIGRGLPALSSQSASSPGPTTALLAPEQQFWQQSKSEQQSQRDTVSVPRSPLLLPCQFCQKGISSSWLQLLLEPLPCLDRLPSFLNSSRS